MSGEKGRHRDQILALFDIQQWEDGADKTRRGPLTKRSRLSSYEIARP